MKLNQYFLLVFALTICVLEADSQTYGWFAQSSGTTNNLNSVWFVNTSTGTAVGNAGTILRTTNSGTNWSAQTSGTPNHLFGVYFLNANTGWASGDVGMVLKTTNGGTSWVIQVSNTVYQLHSINFLSASTGYIVGWYGTIVKTTNGGSAWIALTTGSTNNLHGISFPSASTGYAVGWHGTILKTVNSGSNWYPVTSGTTNSFEAAYFMNEYTGTVIGEGGRVQRTTNGGANWVVQTSGTGSWLNGITSPDVNAVTIAGESGALRKTSNGGTNWLSQTSNTSYWLNKIYFTDTLNGWAVGDYGTIIHTTTGGWLLPAAPSLSAPANNSTCVSMTVLLDWGDIFPPACNYRIQISTNSGFTAIVKDTSGLMVSQFQIPSGLLNYNTQYYWRVSAANQVGGGPWSGTRNFTTTRPAPLAPVLVSPTDSAVGISLTPLLEWDSVASASTYRLRVSTDTSFASTVLDTAGLTASQFQVPSGKLQNSGQYFWRVNGSNVCVTGAWSETWSFNTLITGTGVSGNAVPKVFKLYVNYPNPFNPVTTIKFDLPDEAPVVIKIYNLIGEEVRVLMNENKKAGSYSISFSGENLPSGVYFYTISAGRYTDTKKMVLLK